MMIRENLEKIKNKVKVFFIKPNKNKDDKKPTGFKLLEVLVLVAMGTMFGVFSGSFLTYNYTLDDVKEEAKEDHSKYMNEFEEAFQNVLDNYYEEVDKEKLIDSAIDGMLSTLDGYTSYMNADETKQFNERMNGEYKGIGIEFTTAEGFVHTVVNVFENTPAYVAGVKVGDQLVSVDDIDASTKTGTEIASYIKGTKIKEIVLVVKRDGKDITLNITKSLIELPSVTKKTFDQTGKKVGYINVSLFADNTYMQFFQAVNSLESEGISSLVIDLRNNSGGYLHAADDMLELFLERGDILYKMEDKDGITDYIDQTEENRTYPVVVLINEYSASASEIVAGAMKEVYGAHIVGTTSYGKGTVQQPSDLTNGGMIKVTTDKWLTPDGNWINEKGIAPTTEVKQGDTYGINPTDENDTQLQKALELLTK
ncbi:MAG: S41 family peptidase [Bacilli bacterium]|nr:S41 family peptidase [Bacilli bacterium]MDD4411127.1 S41 family peptidase [Bacilli bacterium]